MSKAAVECPGEQFPEQPQPHLTHWRHRRCRCPVLTGKLPSNEDPGGAVQLSRKTPPPVGTTKTGLIGVLSLRAWRAFGVRWPCHRTPKELGATTVLRRAGFRYSAENAPLNRRWLPRRLATAAKVINATGSGETGPSCSALPSEGIRTRARFSGGRRH